MQSSKTFTRKYLKKLPLTLLFLLAFFIGAVFLFALITHEVIWEKEQEFDYYIFTFFSDHLMNPKWTGIMKTITFFASANFLQIGYSILVILYLLQRDQKRAMEITAVGIGGFIINYFLKLTFQRSRPPHPLLEPLNNFSYPSGHATSGFIFYGLLVYLLWKTQLSHPFKYVSAFVLILFAFLIGFSRIYLRMHYPSDVLAGFCVGFAWLSLSIWLLEQLKKKTHQELDQ